MRERKKKDSSTPRRHNKQHSTISGTLTILDAGHRSPIKSKGQVRQTAMTWKPLQTAVPVLPFSFFHFSPNNKNVLSRSMSSFGRCHLPGAGEGAGAAYHQTGLFIWDETYQHTALRLSRLTELKENSQHGRTLQQLH